MRVGFVRELWRYPVKSMAGETLAECRIAERYGVPGDRGWALRDEEAGEIRGAKKIPALLQLGARYLEPPSGAATPPVSITLESGDEIRSDDPDASARLSKHLGRRVTLCARRPAEDREHYRRAEPITDMEATIRETSELLPDEPTPVLSEVPVDLSIVADHVSPPGTYFDYFQLHLLTTQSVASLAALAPGSQIDRRRFRPNLLIEAVDGLSGFCELDWCGKGLAIGDVRLDVVMPMMRCGMITCAQAELPRDPSIMRALVRDCDMNLGVGAQVLEAGRARVGDEVRLIEVEPRDDPEECAS
jgi:uncharacterized protein YcbX